MAVAPLIAMKGSKVESLEAVGKELDRRAHTYKNDVADHHRHISYRCRDTDAHPVPLEKAVERRMEELHTKRKIRDNQVRAMGFIVSSNDALPTESDARAFLDQSIQWFGARYGYENLLAAEIHLDEGTAHAHIWIAPVIHDCDTGYDRLCAKELFAPDKRRKNKDGVWEVVAQGTMSRLQEDFYQQVSSKWGYERPLRNELRAKGYKSLEAYKVQVGTTRKLKAELSDLAAEKDKAEEEVKAVSQDVVAANIELDVVMNQIQEAVKAKERAERERDEAVSQKNEAVKAKEQVDRSVAQARERLESLQADTRAVQRDIDGLDRACGSARQSVKFEFNKATERAPNALYAFLRDHEGTWAGDVLKALVEGFEGVKQRLARGVEMLKPTSWQNRSKMQAVAAREAAGRTVVTQKQVSVPDLRKHH